MQEIQADFLKILLRIKFNVIGPIMMLKCAECLLSKHHHFATDTY